MDNDKTPKERLANAIAAKKKQRTRAAGKVEQRVQTVDDALASVGIRNNPTIKAQLVEAMRSGAISSAADLSAWLAQRAPAQQQRPQTASVANNIKADTARDVADVLKSVGL